MSADLRRMCKYNREWVLAARMVTGPVVTGSVVTGPVVTGSVAGLEEKTRVYYITHGFVSARRSYLSYSPGPDPHVAGPKADPKCGAP